MRSTLLTLAFTALAAAPAVASGDDWYADYDEALAVAKEQQKDLLVDFTGSDWCVWCHRLDDEVFGVEGFMEGVQDKYVLVKLDFPNDQAIKDAVPNPERNNELMERWGVRGFPTVLAVDTESRPFAKTGYMQGGPDAWLTDLDEKVTSGRVELKKVSALLERFDEAAPEAREAVLGDVIGMLEAQADDSLFTIHLTPYVRKAFAMEGESAGALKARALTALFAKGVYDAELDGFAQELDPQNTAGLRELAMRSRLETLRSIEDVGAWVEAAVALVEEVELVDDDVARELYVTIAGFSDQYLDDAETAKTYAAKALTLGGIEGSRTVEMLEKIVGTGEEQS